MQLPRTSLIIVSRQRPALLARCLTACGELHHPALEIIVVADPGGINAARAHPLGPALKRVPFDQANISAARNRGLAEAAGEVIAFLDDDSIPEPLWLWHLSAAFRSPAIAAATGFTRRASGMRLQSGAAWALSDGRTEPFALPSDAPVAITPPPGRGVKTEGTNMAFRRATLARLGGFDDAFAFYLDETDLNLRLAQNGHATAIVPHAQVVHTSALSPYRQSNQAPRRLDMVGRSLAVFLRKHGPAPHGPAIAAERARRRASLIRAMMIGRIPPPEVNRLLAQFDQGVRDGQAVALAPPKALTGAPPPFAPLPERPFAPQILSGRLWNRRALRRAAAAQAKAGGPVTLILLSRSAIYHRERFTPDGYWEHRGGLFGRARATDPLFRFWRFHARIEHEIHFHSDARFHKRYKPFLDCGRDLV